MSSLGFDLKIERVVSENYCNSSLIRMCGLCRKYRVSVCRSRVAIGGQPCLGENTEMNPHLFASSQSCFEVGIPAVTDVVGSDVDGDGTAIVVNCITARSVGFRCSRRVSTVCYGLRASREKLPGR
jgi:hypothetical protein